MKKIFLLAVALMGAVSVTAQQSTTMLTKLVNGAVVRTDVSEVAKITFADTVYNLNSAGLRILEAHDVCWPEDRLLPVFPAPLASVRTLDMNAAKLSDEERVMFCTLQGIVNRSRPRILLYNHNEEPQSTWPTAHGLRTIVISSSAPYNLLKLYKDEIKGLVLYSNERTNHYSNLAVTVAGLERLLPVTAAVRDKLVANGMDFPVVEDLTQLTYSNAVGVYTYLYNNYWSRCSHRLLISERPNIPYVHDIGAACGSACVWLDPRTTNERALLDKMLSAIKLKENGVRKILYLRKYYYKVSIGIDFSKVKFSFDGDRILFSGVKFTRLHDISGELTPDPGDINHCWVLDTNEDEGRAEILQSFDYDQLRYTYEDLQELETRKSLDEEAGSLCEQYTSVFRRNIAARFPQVGFVDSIEDSDTTWYALKDGSAYLMVRDVTANMMQLSNVIESIAASDSPAEDKKS